MSTWDDKPNDYEHALVMLRNQHNAAIEECVQVITQMGARYHQGRDLIVALRALKDKP